MDRADASARRPLGGGSRTVWIAAAAVMIAAQGCVSVYVGGKGRGKFRETEVQPAERWYTVNRVLLLEVDGVIVNKDVSAVVTEIENTVASVKERLDRAKEDPLIRGVILRINSPGGGVTASDIIYQELLRFKQEQEVPLVACIMDTGASGGYYIAMACDRVVAHPTSVTGSVGVIVQYLTFDGLMKKFGVSGATIKSGPHKDMGSPLRATTESDLKIFQATVDDMYERFVDVVVAGRPNLTEDKIRALADGRIYTAAQAKGNGLIDEIGYLQDAFETAKRLAGIRDASIVTYQRPGGNRNNIYARSGAPAHGARQINLFNVDLGQVLSHNSPRFLYLWSPSMP